MSGWLHADEAAKVSGLCAHTLRRLVLRGRIPAWALLETGDRTGRYRYSRRWCEGDARPRSAEATCA